MVFDPKLETSFRFNEPTGGGTSAIGVIGGLVGDFLSVESKMQGGGRELTATTLHPVSYTHLTLPTIHVECRSRWSPYH